MASLGGIRSRASRVAVSGERPSLDLARSSGPAILPGRGGVAGTGGVLHHHVEIPPTRTVMRLVGDEHRKSIVVAACGHHAQETQRSQWNPGPLECSQWKVRRDVSLISRLQ